MNNNPKKHTTSILGALACLVLFLILLGLKYSPNAPFPDMHPVILSIPIWVPVIILFVFIIFYCIYTFFELMIEAEDKELNERNDILDQNPFNPKP